MDKRTRDAYGFFRERGGMGARYALELAKSEQWARENDVAFSWEWDEDPDLSWCETCEHLATCENGRGRRYIPEHDRGCHDCTNRAHREANHEHEVFGCVATGPDDAGASCWGITDPDDHYRRIMEAELACELRGEVEGKRDAATAEAEGLADLYARHFAE